MVNSPSPANRPTRNLDGDGRKPTLTAVVVHEGFPLHRFPSGMAAGFAPGRPFSDWVP